LRQVRRCPSIVVVRRYAPYYCEENVWWLADEPRFADAHVVVISNRPRTVAMGAQRAGNGGVALWDYHVVLACDGAIWDLDCTLGTALPLRRWLEASFDPRAPDRLAPRFRVIEGAIYRARFASDRRHMRGADGVFVHEPPPWPVIGGGAHDLDRLLDLEDATFGPWLDMHALLGSAAAVR
jgi:hypothetical protein